MNAESFTPPASQASRLPRLGVIGVGGAGSRAVDYMLASDMRDVTFASVQTNMRALESASAPIKLLLGESIVHGLGAGGDPEVGRAAADEDSVKVKQICAGIDLVFVVAGLGGGTGSGAAPIIARTAKEAGALTVAVVALPFDFEGTRRQRQAQASLHALKTSADAVICLPNQKILKLVDEKTRVTETFQIANDLLCQGILGIRQMLVRPGLIQVDFADLCSVVRGRHTESYFANAQAAGERRVRDIIDKLLASPLLNGGQTLAESDAFLVSLVGGSDLTMAEVSRLMEQLGRHSENANVVMGAAIDPDFEGRLEVTVIASRRKSESDPVEMGSAKSGNSAAGAPIENQFFAPAPQPQRASSRFIPPPPELTPEKSEELLLRKTGSAARARKTAQRWRQGQLPLEIVSKGRFEKGEPTIHRGEDLDVPTYIRRGIALN